MTTQTTPTYTWTEHTFVCTSCHRTARASAEAIADQRRNNDCAGETDAEIVEGFYFCLACVAGIDAPGEFVEPTDGIEYTPKGVYQEIIDTILRARGLHRYIDPRHVEAWMRSEHATLDGLSREDFAKSASAAIQTILFDHAGISERLAQSVGI